MATKERTCRKTGLSLLIVSVPIDPTASPGKRVVPDSSVYPAIERATNTESAAIDDR